MTQINEGFYYKNMRMDFAEFLEMICRIAGFKFVATELDDLDLPSKIGYILDDLLPLIEVYRRNDPENKDLEIC